jgi:hypothetical protein
VGAVANLKKKATKQEKMSERYMVLEICFDMIKNEVEKKERDMAKNVPNPLNYSVNEIDYV